MAPNLASRHSPRFDSNYNIFYTNLGKNYNEVLKLGFGQFYVTHLKWKTL